LQRHSYFATALIVVEFEQVEKETRAARYEQAVLNSERVRKLGGGHKGSPEPPFK
jgi:hypothetical protein